MSFMVKKITINAGTVAVKLLEADKSRTHADIYNESGEQIRYGAKDVTNAAGGGMPIVNGQHGIFYKAIGLDPTVERWGVGSAGGTVTVIEEWV